MLSETRQMQESQQTIPREKDQARLYRFANIFMDYGTVSTHD